MIFNDFLWHDAIIKNIVIDRNAPGVYDNISFFVEWSTKENVLLSFEGVYWSIMELNFGVIADETILKASCSVDDDDLDKFYSKWKGLMNNVKLFSYEINLNSTGGRIKILAKTFTVTPV